VDTYMNRKTITKATGGLAREIVIAWDVGGVLVTEREGWLPTGATRLQWEESCISLRFSELRKIAEAVLGEPKL